MELRRVQTALGAFHRGHGAHVGRGRYREPCGNLGHGVAVAHPHRLLDGRLAVQRRRSLVAPRQRRGPVLALLGVAHGAAQRDGHNLLAVAEAQHGDVQLEDARVDGRRVLGVHAGRAARQDDGRGRKLAHLVGGDVAWDDFRVHAQVAHSPRDQRLSAHLHVFCMTGRDGGIGRAVPRFVRSLRRAKQLMTQCSHLEDGCIGAQLFFLEAPLL